jgi:hypothetical protein
MTVHLIDTLQNVTYLGLNNAMTNNFLAALEAIRGKGYGGFFSSVFNVEGGQASIADERMASCDECYGSESASIDCSECGRTSKNFIQFRSGDGDGIYAVVDLCIPAGESLGGLLIFDRNIVGNMLSMVENGSPQLFDLDFSEVMEEMEGVCIGNLTLLGDPNDGRNYCFYVGDSGADNSGRYALSYFNAKPGEYSVILFGMRQAALILPRKRLKEFGLTDKHDWSSEEIDSFAVGSMTDIVMSHMNPAGLDAVAYNVDLNTVDFSDQDELIPSQFSSYISWIFQLNEFAPERMPTHLRGLFTQTPQDELEQTRIEAAEMRGYILPPPSDKPKKRSLFK